MDIKIYPRKLRGKISIIPSKSEAHRLLICAAFSDKPTTLLCADVNEDIEATARCLCALGAEIQRTKEGFLVIPIKAFPKTAELDCGESGSTLRFLLPMVCALGVEASIHMSGRLPYRPLSPMWEELERMGCVLTRPTDTTIHTSGKLQPGEYCIAGNISSQFISGLLFALSLIPGQSRIKITEKLESRPYVELTQNALSTFGVQTKGFHIEGSYPFRSPGTVQVEGDWSNGAFFLAAVALGSPITVDNLSSTSAQGDRAITALLEGKENPLISLADIPDLAPILSVYFGARGGATFTDIARLRLKESDRVASIQQMLEALGIHSISDENTLQVFSGKLTGGIVDAQNDHRIAMAAGIAATVADGPVTILGAECVAKSYPQFWSEYARLGGNYEQYVR